MLVRSCESTFDHRTSFQVTLTGVEQRPRRSESQLTGSTFISIFILHYLGMTYSMCDLCELGGMLGWKIFIMHSNNLILTFNMWPLPDM